MAWTAFDEGDAPFGPFDRCRASENGRFARAAKQPADQLLDAPKVVGDPAVSKTDPLRATAPESGPRRGAGAKQLKRSVHKDSNLGPADCKNLK